ncbi:MAG: 2-oxo acid dehydrogenase subunit E2 [Bacteroidales bacterium]|nr:2-oxo acid dehydrogenase subunit E2 [Bacteroidales bacterium]
MASPILLPRQGQSVESCIISQFYVAVGETVSVGTPLFSFETDKASFEEEAKEEGVVLALFFEEGEEVPVLTNVGVIGKEGESFEEFIPEVTGDAGSNTLVEATKEAVSEEPARQAFVASGSTAPVTGDIFISPRAKKLAGQHAIDFRGIAGSGPEGRIIEKDMIAVVERHGKKTPLAKEKMRREGLVPGDMRTGPGQVIRAADLLKGDTSSTLESELVKIPHIRRLIAKAMHQSLQNSAQLTHHLSADARRILEWRKKVKQAGGANITLNDMICYAAIRTLKAYPNVNAHYLGDNIRIFKGVHLGLAVDTERGLMVPAVKNADRLSIRELSERMKGLADACRSGSIDPELLKADGASFTVSNLGNYGVEMFTPVINLPQVAILGVNTIIPRPMDMGDGVYSFVPHLGLSLTYDHQALDGGEATRFLRALADEIEYLELSF